MDHNHNYKHNENSNENKQSGKIITTELFRTMKAKIYVMTLLLLFSIICAEFFLDAASANENDSQEYIGEAFSMGTDNAEIYNDERVLLRSSSSDYSVNHTVTLSGDRLYSEAYKVLDLINTERASVGLPAVSMDYSLMESAMLRAAEAVIYCTHTRPDNTDCFTAVTRSYSMLGENLAAGQTSASRVMSDWMQSEGHKANILTSGFTCAGVGVFKIDGIIYWIQIFSDGTPEMIVQPNDCTVDQNISASENRLNLLFNPSEISVVPDDPIQLTVYNFKDSISFRTHALTSEEFVWSSSDPLCIRVNDGIISALGPGSAVITVNLGDLTAQCTAVSCMPEQVNNLQALSFNHKIRLNWQSVSGADGYHIYAMYSDGSKYKTYDTVNNYCYFSKLTNGNTYQFMVRAYKTVNNSNVYGAYSSTISASTVDDTIQNLKAASYDQKIRLTWDETESADGYYIYAMYSDGSKYKTYSTTKTSCNFTSLINGSKYNFKIRTYQLDSNGVKGYGDYSASVSATPRMDAVSGFKALAFDKKVNVSWDKMDKADGYYINVVYSDGTLYKNYSTTKTYCNFTKLTNSKTYKFRVRAYELNSKGSKVYGKYTSYESVKPYNDKVTGLKAVPGANKIALSWTAVDKAEGYNIYAMYADGSKYKTYNTTKTTCNFNNLISGKTYQFKVKEYKKNAAGSKVYGTYSKVVKSTAN